jgi:hypothetical protein
VPEGAAPRRRRAEAAGAPLHHSRVAAKDGFAMKKIYKPSQVKTCMFFFQGIRPGIMSLLLQAKPSSSAGCVGLPSLNFDIRY